MRFMQGRNGVDSIFVFCFVLYLILFGLNRLFVSPWIYYIGFVILFYALFRYLSTNLVKRQEENEAFKRLIAKFVPKASAYRHRLLEGQEYSFHECPYCGTTLRFKRRKGTFSITCPKCHHQLTVKKWL